MSTPADRADTPAIRPATAADHDALMTLMGELQTADAKVAPELSRPVLDVILDRDGLTLFVAEWGGEVIGSCYLNVTPNLTRGLRPYALIENVVTAPSVRGRGFGRALLAHACEAARDAGCYKVMLLTGRKDAAIHAFYRSCGFDGEAKFGYYRKL